MHWMSGRARLATVALAVIAAAVVGGCGGGVAGDKAGGAGEPVVLRMANPNGDLHDVPAVQDFVSLVEERSGGNLRIQVEGPWGDYANDAEQQIVRAVAAGKTDLGWGGVRVFDTMGVTSFQALRALGAAPMEVFRRSRNQALAADTLAGFEMNLLLYEHNVLANRAPYVTVNVSLWPQMDVLLANPDRLARLTGQQRGWLQQAAEDAAGRSAALTDRANRDAQGLKNACQSGARFATASQADLAALRKAFAPVSASLEQNPQTKAFIQQIQTLKQATPVGAPLVIPVGCTGKAPAQPTWDTGTAPAALNGTYRWTITQQDALPVRRRTSRPSISQRSRRSSR